MAKKNDFNIFERLHDKLNGNNKKNKRYLSYTRNPNICKHCAGEMFYDNINAYKVCENCGVCVKYHTFEFDDLSKYHETHRKKTIKRYYDEEKMLEKRLIRCTELTISELGLIIKIFSINKRIIKQAYLTNKKRNLDYSFLCNKLLKYCGLDNYGDKYFPINKKNNTMIIYENIWGDILKNMVK